MYGTKAPKKLNKSFRLHFNVAEENVSMMVKEYSPMVAKIDVFQYGSNQLRKKLNHIPALDLTKNRTMEPIVKGKNFKSREIRQEPKKDVNPD